MGHIRIGVLGKTFAYAWHIYLFFFLSGMVFREEKYLRFIEFVIKKVKSRLIPYVIFSFLIWVVWALFSYFTLTNVDSY